VARERKRARESQACRAAESRLQMCEAAPEVFSKYQQHMSSQLQHYQSWLQKNNRRIISRDRGSMHKHTHAQHAIGAWTHASVPFVLYCKDSSICYSSALRVCSFACIYGQSLVNLTSSCCLPQTETKWLVEIWTLTDLEWGTLGRLCTVWKN